MKVESRIRVEELLAENNYDPDIVAELKVRSHIGASREEKKAAKDFAEKEQKKRIDERNERISEENAKATTVADGMGFVLAGVFFLIVAIVLFVISIKPLDKETAKILGVDSVANIQCTVFSAASLIISIVSFCCKGLVRYMKH